MTVGSVHRFTLFHGMQSLPGYCSQSAESAKSVDRNLSLKALDTSLRWYDSGILPLWRLLPILHKIAIVPLVCFVVRIPPRNVVASGLPFAQLRHTIAGLDPNIAVPILTIVEPAAIASRKSSLMPIESSLPMARLG